MQRNMFGCCFHVPGLETNRDKLGFKSDIQIILEQHGAENLRRMNNTTAVQGTEVYWSDFVYGTNGR